MRREPFKAHYNVKVVLPEGISKDQMRRHLLEVMADNVNVESGVLTESDACKIDKDTLTVFATNSDGVYKTGKARADGTFGRHSFSGNQVR